MVSLLLDTLIVSPLAITRSFVFTHYPTQNRFALLLEMLY
ncbi:hypothetical protein OHAE_767 [Ochrobactrum soli]|uniref:Uncharacterized protein n=1 Tax=Ochrobactrum soli TaxID=2448455 RepID=A0A2P9HM20_9HYPH|nr:hypothetical protein OHAE_767 [[Ochrobactrum] soli]